MMLLLILPIFITVSISIGIPIRRYELKCMIVYTSGQSQSVKINAKLPEIPDRLQEEYYEIFIKNTQTNEEIVEKSLPGVYKRQLSLTQNIIYEVCFRIESQRDFGRFIIQYTAENLFNIDHREINIPDNLLKSGDFKRAYLDAQRLHTVTGRFTELQKTRKQIQSEIFVQNNEINSRLLYISIGEIAIIVVAGVYQFFTLRKYLANKQYI